MADQAWSLPLTASQQHLNLHLHQHPAASRRQASHQAEGGCVHYVSLEVWMCACVSDVSCGLRRVPCGWLVPSVMVWCEKLLRVTHNHLTQGHVTVWHTPTLTVLQWPQQPIAEGGMCRGGEGTAAASRHMTGRLCALDRYREHPASCRFAGA